MFQEKKYACNSLRARTSSRSFVRRLSRKSENTSRCPFQSADLRLSICTRYIASILHTNTWVRTRDIIVVTPTDRPDDILSIVYYHEKPMRNEPIRRAFPLVKSGSTETIDQCVMEFARPARPRPISVARAPRRHKFYVIIDKMRNTSLI